MRARAVLTCELVIMKRSTRKATMQGIQRILGIRRIRGIRTGERAAKGRLWSVGWGLVALAFIGCTDAAQADYEQCEKLDRQGEFEQALKACQQAQQKDSRSAAGAKAISLESKLHDKIAARKLEQQRDAEHQGDSEALAQAEEKVHLVQVSTPPNDPQGYSERCMAKNRAYENSYHCEPKDPSQAAPNDPFPMKNECLLLAKSKGCLPFYDGTPTKLFCCTK